MLSDDEETVTYLDDRGITRRDFKERQHHSMPDFVAYPINAPRLGRELAWRYDPDTPGRFPRTGMNSCAAGPRHPLVISAYPHLGMFGPARPHRHRTHGADVYDDPGLIRTSRTTGETSTTGC